MEMEYWRARPIDGETATAQNGGPSLKTKRRGVAAHVCIMEGSDSGTG